MSAIKLHGLNWELEAHVEPQIGSWANFEAPTMGIIKTQHAHSLQATHTRTETHTHTHTHKREGHVNTPLNMLGYTIWSCYQSENSYTLRIRDAVRCDAHAFRCESWHVAYTQCAAAAFGQQYVTHSAVAYTGRQAGGHEGRQSSTPRSQRHYWWPATVLKSLAEPRQQATGNGHQATGDWQLATASELPITARQCIKMP